MSDQPFSTSDPAPAIRVAVVDDHPMMREALRALLDRAPGIAVVGLAGQGRAAVRIAQKHPPDVMLLDIGLPDISGIEVVRQVRKLAPAVRFVILTGHDQAEYASVLLALGVRGYVPKTVGGCEIVAAIRHVASGRRYLAGAAASSDPHAEHHLDLLTTRELTTREREVLELLVKGLHNAEIARELVLSVKTVDFHVGNVLGKLGARSRTEAVCIALRLNLCKPPDTERPTRA